MPERQQQRVGIRALRGFALLTQQGTQHIQAAPQPSHQSAISLQRKNRPERLGGGFDRCSRQQLAEQLPEHARPDTVSRQNVGQKDRESLSTTAALAAVRAEDPLSSHGLPGAMIGIVAVKNAMPV